MYVCDLTAVTHLFAFFFYYFPSYYISVTNSLNDLRMLVPLLLYRVFKPNLSDEMLDLETGP